VADRFRAALRQQSQQVGADLRRHGIDFEQGRPPSRGSAAMLQDAPAQRT
jgi:hypothetical protein